MNKKYSSPYYEMLATLLKNDELSEIEQKIFETFAFAKSPCFSVRDLIRIIFDKNLGTKGHNTKLEQEIRKGIRSLQDRAVPLIPCGQGMYYLAQNLDLVKSMIFGLESKASQLRYRADIMWIYYERQIEPFQKLIDESKRSS